MKEKYYEFTSVTIMSAILTILGMILLIGKSKAYHHLIDIVILIIWLNSLRELIKFIFRKLNKKEQKQTFLNCFFHITVCIILSIVPNFILGIAPFLFAIYLLIITITQMIMIILELKEKEKVKIKHIAIIIGLSSIAIPILFSPISNINTFVICVSIYSILLGLSMFIDNLNIIISKKTKSKFKRNIKITFPKIFEAIIPYSIMQEINNNVKQEKKTIYTYEKEKRKINLEILIHTSNRGANKVGHIDIYFQSKVYSFGNYDEGSRTHKEFFGDGVLFISNRKKEYINFCIDNSKKTVFDFGIHLTKKQEQAIKEKIKIIRKECIPWNHKQDKLYNNANSYAGRLYKKTKAHFYKFPKGKYHTYFVLGTNCCTLVDDIVGKIGIDIISLNGIITPGTYYDYLNRMLKQKKSNVISKEIYNYKRRP